MVHFELTNDMLTEEFLSALRYMINRRGWSHTVVSDDQNSSEKGQKVLEMPPSALFKNYLNEETIQKFRTENKISRQYITERAPHCGGLSGNSMGKGSEPAHQWLGFGPG